MTFDAARGYEDAGFRCGLRSSICRRRSMVFFGHQDRREAWPQRCEVAIVKQKVDHALADIDVTDSLAKRYSFLIGDAISDELQPVQRMFPERCDQQIAIPPGVKVMDLLDVGNADRRHPCKNRALIIVMATLTGIRQPAFVIDEDA